MKSHKFMRFGGVSEIQFGMYLVAAVMVGLAVWWLSAQWASHNEAMIEKGRKEERLVWQEQQRKDKINYDLAATEIRRESNLALGALQASLAKAQGDYEKKRQEADHAKAENDRVARGLRDGSIVLNIPAPGDQTGGGRPGANPPDGTGAGGNAGAAKPSQLPGYVSGFLFSEAARADTVIEGLETDLGLALDTARAYYLLAKDCREARLAPN